MTLKEKIFMSNGISKDKLQKALNHQEGAIPIDFGSTLVTGMHVTVLDGLRKHYALEQRPIKICDPYQMLGLIEDDLRETLGIDTIAINSPKTIFGFPLDEWKEWKAPWGQELLVPGAFNITSDKNGIYLHPEGDTTIAPSGHMPTSSYFFDTIIRQGVIQDNELNVDDNTEEFGIVSEEDIEYYQVESDRAAASGYGVVVSSPGTSFGDIALIPAPFLKNPKGIRDITEWYMSIAMRQDYIHAIFERQLEVAIYNLIKLKEKMADKIDVVFICGTDFGTQHGKFCSLETFRVLWKPYYIKLNNWIHENTDWKTFKHCCGSIFDLVESGFDILNPVQCSADNMDPKTLKKTFGDKIVFWGGGVDTQRTLPFGTPQEVKEEVRERCEIFSKGGGFVFNDSS